MVLSIFFATLYSNQRSQMEKTPETVLFQSHQNLESISLIFCAIVLNLIFLTLDKFYPKYLNLACQYMPILLSDISLFCKETKSPRREEDKKKNYQETETETKFELFAQDSIIRGEEIELIMARMGLATSRNGVQIKDYTRNEEFTSLFEHSEPGFDEINEAFFVFDQNKDGFIDANELQRVLIALGLRAGADLAACQIMIDQHDRNHDGKIDLTDFSKLLEISLL